MNDPLGVPTVRTLSCDNLRCLTRALSAFSGSCSDWRDRSDQACITAWMWHHSLVAEASRVHGYEEIKDIPRFEWLSIANSNHLEVSSHTHMYTPTL